MHFVARSLVVAVPFFSLACALERDPIAPGAGESPLFSASIACGTVITADLKLEEDLTCPGDALIVGADGIEIDLNGHTLAGSAVGLGITVRARRNIYVHGGTISGFVTGVMLATSTKVLIKDMRMTQNREAVFLAASSGNTVKENVIWENQLRGVMIRPNASGVISTDNLVKENVLTDNPTGILVFGQPGNTLKENSITGSSVAGIDFISTGASGNLVKENLLMSNAAGIRLAVGWTGNIFAENRIQLNACGIEGSIAGNTLSENLFAANGVDFCTP